MTSLAANIPRCPGVEFEDGGFREGCEDCMRRTSASYPESGWIAPPGLVVFECESRIPPEA